MAKARPQSSFSLAAQLIGAQGLKLAVLFAISATMAINIEDTIRTLTPEQENIRWGLHLTLGIWELLEGALFFLILSWGIVKVRDLGPTKGFLKDPFQRAYLPSFAAEYLRMLAQVLLWAILLLIPGFVRYAQLIFVPYIALFSEAYQRDDVDALEFSRELTRKRFSLIFAVLLGATALQLSVEFAPHLATSLYTVPIRAVFIGLSFLISIWTYSFMFRRFEDALEG